jgi:hypothetical protein
LAVGGEGFEDLVGGFVHTNGLGSLFRSLIHWRMSVSSSVTLRWAERRSLRVVSSASQRPARLSQLELAGVKCGWNRGCLSSQSLIAGKRDRQILVALTGIRIGKQTNGLPVTGIFLIVSGNPLAGGLHYPEQDAAHQHGAAPCQFI